MYENDRRIKSNALGDTISNSERNFQIRIPRKLDQTQIDFFIGWGAVVIKFSTFFLVLFSTIFSTQV